MPDILSNSVRFVKLHLRDYGIFRGSNEIDFDRHRTLIVGRGGTGKTTIFNALRYLGPAPGIKSNFYAKNHEMFVEVMTRGNRELVKSHRKLIFFDHETVVNSGATFLDILDNKQQKIVADEARAIFQTILTKKTRKIDVYWDLSPETMSGGEKVCLSYAIAFAVRKVLNLNLPAVLDSPYGFLDTKLRNGVIAFLKMQSFQQILLGHESEFNEEDKPHYILDYDYTKEYSRVIGIADP